MNGLEIHWLDITWTLKAEIYKLAKNSFLTDEERAARIAELDAYYAAHWVTSVHIYRVIEFFTFF